MLFVVLLLIGFLIGAAVILRVDKNILPFLFNPDDKGQKLEPITELETVVTCKPGDATCTSRNEKIIIENISGEAVDMAKHQCDGPRACPTPNQEQTTEYESAIHSFAKDPKLELIKVTGINPAGVIHYCAKDSRCWKYDTKLKRVEAMSSEQSATTSAGKE